MGASVKSNPTKTIYKSSRHPSIKEGIGYNRYDGKVNGRNMINGVPCVKFNKGIELDELIYKANNKVYIPKIQPTSNKTIKTKQSEAPSHKHHFHGAMLVITCIVGARMARSW